jgi:hypothetical protein
VGWYVAQCCDLGVCGLCSLRGENLAVHLPQRVDQRVKRKILDDWSDGSAPGQAVCWCRSHGGHGGALGCMDGCT